MQRIPVEDVKRNGLACLTVQGNILIKEIDITNAFYESLGFEELECFPTLWDEWNPCQVYVKYIGDLAKVGK